MNYDRIILEMLERIQTLEEEMKILKNSMESSAKHNDFTDTHSILKESSGGQTEMVRQYIQKLKADARERGLDSIVLVANDIHKNLNLKNKMPIVCNAMKQCMGSNDMIAHETPSGYSSTFSVKYYL